MATKGSSGSPITEVVSATRDSLVELSREVTSEVFLEVTAEVFLEVTSEMDVFLGVTSEVEAFQGVTLEAVDSQESIQESELRDPTLSAGLEEAAVHQLVQPARPPGQDHNNAPPTASAYRTASVALIPASRPKFASPLFNQSINQLVRSPSSKQFSQSVRTIHQQQWLLVKVFLWSKVFIYV